MNVELSLLSSMTRPIEVINMHFLFILRSFIYEGYWLVDKAFNQTYFKNEYSLSDLLY